jgi:hypothetical protein
MGPCDRCGQQAWPNPCPGDGSEHHHGRVHIKGGGLQAVCHECWKQVYDEWNPGEALR